MLFCSFYGVELPTNKLEFVVLKILSQLLLGLAISSFPFLVVLRYFWTSCFWSGALCFHLLFYSKIPPVHTELGLCSLFFLKIISLLLCWLSLILQFLRLMSQVDSPCMKILDPVFAPTLQHMLLKVNKHHIYDLFFSFFFFHNFIIVA